MPVQKYAATRAAAAAAAAARTHFWRAWVPYPARGIRPVKNWTWFLAASPRTPSLPVRHFQPCGRSRYCSEPALTLLLSLARA